MKHKILLAALIAFSSCMKLKKKDAEEVSPQQSAKTVELTTNQKIERASLEIAYEFDEGDSRVVFFAPSNWPSEMIIKKTDSGKEFEVIANFDSTGKWSDLLLSEGKVNYKFFVRIGKSLTLVDDVDILPALDMHVEEDIDLYSKYQLNSKIKMVYFKNLVINLQKHLFIGSYSGKIVVDKLISNSGYIQTFATDARAQNDQPGRGGGVINIEIRSGVGSLNVVMKGENGGNGSAAKDADAALKGAQGSRGARADFAGEPVPGSYFGAVFKCVRQPGVGGMGFQGKQGYPGQPGKSGGNSGSVTIINSSSNLKIELYSQVGAFGYGSIGGQGGEGGDGGFGGDGAEKDFEIYLRDTKQCNIIPGIEGCNSFGTLGKCDSSAPQGPRGERGPQGPPGRDGNNGITEKSCLFLNDEKINCTNAT